MLCVWLTACGGRVSPLPDPCAEGFCAELIWEQNGVLLRARMTAEPPDEEGERRVGLEFLAPEAMAGLCLTRQNGEICAELGGVTWENVAGEGYFLAADLMLATDGLTYVCDTERGGERLRLAEGRYGGGRLERYCAIPGGEPRFLVWEGIEVTVVRVGKAGKPAFNVGV